MGAVAPGESNPGLGCLPPAAHTVSSSAGCWRSVTPLVSFQGHHLLSSGSPLWHAALHPQRRSLLPPGRRWQVSLIFTFRAAAALLLCFFQCALPTTPHPYRCFPGSSLCSLLTSSLPHMVSGTFLFPASSFPSVLMLDFWSRPQAEENALHSLADAAL